MARIDGKYEELRELSRSGAEALLEVQVANGAAPGGPAQGEVLRLGWFDVSTPAARAEFHRYRSALKALSPAGLLDVVARPGAYYSLWRAVEGVPVADFLAENARDADAVDALRDLAARLAELGYALSDAEIVMQGGEPRLARLAPAHRTSEDIAALNAPILARLNGGRVRRRRKAAAPRRPLSLPGVLPGLLFLGGVLALAPRAAQIYLNPPVLSVPDVTGEGAQAAAETLVKAGYRVTFADGEQGDAKLGSVIAQSPKEGSALHAGRLVTLTVNNPPSLTVPKVEELTLDQARSALAESRLKVAEVLTVDGSATGTPSGRVIAQVPEAGVTLARGQGVRLLVSSGVRAEQTWLPDLRGLSAEEARDLVRKAGLVVTKFETRTSDSPENSVLAQVPAPYEKVDVGSAVVLTVARAPLTNPADAVPSLPLAPAPTPPAPTPTPQDPATDPSATPTAPDGTGVPGTAPTPTPPEQSAPSEEGAARRTVQISYTFPAEMPLGNVEIVVRDADGERVVLGAQPTGSVAGNRAEGPVEVRGIARFSVRVNGQEIAAFER